LILICCHPIAIVAQQLFCGWNEYHHNVGASEYKQLGTNTQRCTVDTKPFVLFSLPDIRTRVFYPGIHVGGCFDSRLNLIIVVC
jgi:hypothetical protein